MDQWIPSGSARRDRTEPVCCLAGNKKIPPSSLEERTRMREKHFAGNSTFFCASFSSLPLPQYAQLSSCAASTTYCYAAQQAGRGDLWRLVLAGRRKEQSSHIGKELLPLRWDFRPRPRPPPHSRSLFPINWKMIQQTDAAAS